MSESQINGSIVHTLGKVPFVERLSITGCSIAQWNYTGGHKLSGDVVRLTTFQFLLCLFSRFPTFIKLTMEMYVDNTNDDHTHTPL